MRLPQISFQFQNTYNGQPNDWPLQVWPVAQSAQDLAYYRQHETANNDFVVYNAREATQAGSSDHTFRPQFWVKRRISHQVSDPENKSSPDSEPNAHIDWTSLQPRSPVDSNSPGASSIHFSFSIEESIEEQVNVGQECSTWSRKSKCTHGYSESTYTSDPPLDTTPTVRDQHPPTPFYYPINHQKKHGSLDWSTFEIAKALGPGQEHPTTDGPLQAKTMAESREVEEYKNYLSRRVPETGVRTDSEDSVLVERKAELPIQFNRREQMEPTKVATDSTTTCSARGPTSTIPSPTTIRAEVKRKHDDDLNPSSTNSTPATPPSNYGDSSSIAPSRRSRRVLKTNQLQVRKKKRGPRTPKVNQEIISGPRDKFKMFWVDPSRGKMGNPPIIQEEGLPRQAKRRRTVV